MRDAFRAYYPPTNEEQKKIWDEGLLVLDANSLLNLFRYSAATRDELLALLRKERDRLWIPHQVALEFHRNRRSIADQQLAAFDNVAKALQTAENSSRAAIDSLRRHPRLEADDLTRLLVKHMRKIKKGLQRARKRHSEAVLGQDAHERTLQSITELYEGRVGEAYPADKLEVLYKEGAKRYSQQIPPGYKDESTKSGNNRYGDFILWKQLLDHGAAEHQPVLFITEDEKEDWWDKSGNRTWGHERSSSKSTTRRVANESTSTSLGHT